MAGNAEGRSDAGWQQRQGVSASRGGGEGASGEEQLQCLLPCFMQVVQAHDGTGMQGTQWEALPLLALFTHKSRPHKLLMDTLNTL